VPEGTDAAVDHLGNIVLTNAVLTSRKA